MTGRGAPARMATASSSRSHHGGEQSEHSHRVVLVDYRSVVLRHRRARQRQDEQPCRCERSTKHAGPSSGCHGSSPSSPAGTSRDESRLGHLARALPCLPGSPLLQLKLLPGLPPRADPRAQATGTGGRGIAIPRVADRRCAGTSSASPSGRTWMFVQSLRCRAFAQ